MPACYLLAYPVLADLTYQKIQSVTIFDALNVHRKAHNQAPVAVGPIPRGMDNIKLTRKAYSDSYKPERMFKFIDAFNKLNSFSMVAYLVGMHDNHFRDGESL